MATSKHNQIKKLDKSVAAKSTQTEKSGGFSEEERAAMQERLQEIKSSVDGKHKASPLQEVMIIIVELS